MPKPPNVNHDQRPDGWERFESAIDAALHHRPLHKDSAGKKALSRPKRASKKAAKPTDSRA